MILSLPESSTLTPEELARIGLSRYVAIDLETTGLDLATDRIIEFGAVLFEGGVEKAQFSELAGIDGELDTFISRLTGITDRDLDGKPPAEELLGDFLKFVSDTPIVGQNVEFDLGFLRALQGIMPATSRPRWSPGTVHDTRLLARIFFPTLTSYGLAGLVRQTAVNLDRHHRAVHDARATGLVFLELLARARRTPFGELAEMIRLIGGSSYTIGALLEGLSAIGPGEAGVDSPLPLKDNRLGNWSAGMDEEVADREIDSGGIEDFFAEEGPLAKVISGYQLREGQVEMARDVHEALSGGGVLVAEAGTGTGKSFAYMLPAQLHARAGGGRIIISTHTRHLQSQLFEKDLPALDEVIGGGIRAVVLKGRDNYICRRRYENLTADPDALEPGERLALLPIVRWLNRTVTGDINENTGFRQGLVRGLWTKITSESGFCTGKICRANLNCFLHRIRSSAQSAHLVLINHALLFSDLAAGGGILGEYDRVVFDEAHHVERVAADQLAVEYHNLKLRMVVTRLYDPASEKGVLVRLRALAPMLKGPLERGDAAKDPFEQVVKAVARVVETGDEFNRELDELLRKNETGSDEYMQRVRYRSGRERFVEIGESVEAHGMALQKLRKRLGSLVREFEEAKEELPPVDGDDLIGEVQRLSDEVGQLSAAFDKLTGDADEDTVFWYEVPVRGGRSIRLAGTPLNVGKLLASGFYPRLSTAIFTSATLAVDERFDFINNRLGLGEEARGVIYPSPFDARGQLYIAVADFLGNPKHNPDRFARGVARLAYRLPTELNAGTLVLFTSRKMLRDAYDEASPLLEKDGWLPLGQGYAGGRSEMLERFRSERKSVLFGVASFWEGIDVPGESLELAIIARIPFDVPTDPVVEARSEQIEQAGGNAFIEYSLPEAVLRLRQGIGRLIRTTEDVGAAVICDPRIVHSRWGKVIMRLLPVRPVEYRDYDSLFNDLRRFLRGNS